MINPVFPVLNAVDGWLAALPLLGRSILWGAVAGAGTMLIYALTSNQSVIRSLKAEARSLRQSLLDPAMDPATVGPAVWRNLVVSFALLGRVAGPAILSAIPVVVLAAWLETFHGFVPPGEGAWVSLELQPAGAQAVIAPASRVRAGENGVLWLAASSEEAGPITLYADGREVFTGNPLSPPVPVITKKRWWHYLLASESGYLSPEARIEELRLGVERQRLISGVPDWLGGWEFSFFASVLATALTLKIGFKLE